MKRKTNKHWIELMSALALGLVLLVWVVWRGYDMGGPGDQETVSRQSERQTSVAAEVDARSMLAAMPQTEQEPTVQPLFKLVETLTEPHIPEIPWVGAAVPAAASKVDASSVIDAGSWLDWTRLQEGEGLGFPTSKGALRGTVLSRREDPASGRLWISGKLASLRSGSFAIFKDKKTGEVGGDVLDQINRKAYQILKLGDGRILWQERPLGAVICSGMPPEPRSMAAAAPAGQYAVTVPELDSLPGATAVLYIDFDGETVTDPRWNGGTTIIAQPAVLAGQPITPAQITAVWAAVAEDFAPFNVSVTTIASRYANAPFGKRMRCIQTPTNDAAPSAGGVAYLDSFSLSGSFSHDIPCWSFNSGSVNLMAMTISHEFGHTVGLIHDGLGPPLAEQEYYGGHGTNPLGWGPIMGAPFGMLVTQWSKGEYFGANNTEDDLEVITRPINFGYRTDEAGGTTGTAATVSDLFFGQLNESGILSDAADVDVYRFTTAGGDVQIQAGLPAAPEANVDIKLRLLNSTGGEVQVSDSPATLTAGISTNLAAGQYFIEVSGAGWGTPLSDTTTSGWTPYGSRGQYLITGDFPPLPALPLITRHPESPAQPVREGKPVTFTAAAISNIKFSYQWYKVVGGVETPVAGAKSATYRINAVNASHIADYFIRATNAEGFVDSDPASLDVVLRPRIQTPLPAATTLPVGSPLTFSPVLTGTAPIAIQWFKNGKAIPGQNGPELDFASLEWSDEGTYHFTASNPAGSLKSSSARLTVQSPPILSLPALFAVPLNGKATLTAQVGGSPKLRFQWLKDNVELPGATSAKLVLNGQPDTAGNYQLRVTNDFGVETSAGTTVVVDARLRITQHPVGGSFTREDNITMGVQVEGDGPITYQWQFKGADLPGENAATLNIPSATWFHRGSYRVVVQNRVSRVVSKSTSLVISSRPEIVTQPISAKGARGGTHAFFVRTVGTAKITYQWYKDGQILPGATKSRLPLRNLDTAHEGDYHVVAGNALGEIPSDIATLVVEDPPRVTLQPLAGFFPVGADITAVVQADGAPDLTYQWQRNRRDIPGQNGATLVLPDAELKSSGSYRVVVRNDVGRVFSRAVALTVQVPPQITVPPGAVAIFEGETAVFTVKATGSKTLRYRWLHDGVEVSRSRTLTLKDARLPKQGQYVVEVSNRVGMVDSAPVPLVINTVPAPVIARIVPVELRAGDKFALVGSNLRFAREVRVGGRKVSFVVAPGNQIIGTVPGSFTSGGTVILKSLGGSSEAPAALVVRSTATNDMFANARVVTGSKFNSNVYNFDFSSEPGEPYPNRGKSAWWRWVAPATSWYNLDTAFSSYDTVLAVYQGDVMNQLTFVAANDDVGGGDLTSRLSFSAIEGVTYRFVVDVFSSNVQAGFTNMNLQRVNNMPPVDGHLAYSGSSSQSAVTEQRIETPDPIEQQDAVEETDVWDLVLDSSRAAEGESEALWSPADKQALLDAGKVNVSFDVTLPAAPESSSSEDTFAWTFYTQDEAPALAFSIHAGNGGLSLVNAAGETVELETRLERDSKLGVELLIDVQAGTWSISIDGALLQSDQSLGIEPGSTIQDFVISALPGSGPARARIVCENLRVTAGGSSH